MNKGEPVYLTKNGYGTMVVMSLEKYSELTDEIELKLDEADRLADESTIRYSNDEVFGGIRGVLHGSKAIGIGLNSEKLDLNQLVRFKADFSLK